MDGLYGRLLSNTQVREGTVKEDDVNPSGVSSSHILGKGLLSSKVVVQEKNDLPPTPNPTSSTAKTAPLASRPQLFRPRQTAVKVTPAVIKPTSTLPSQLNHVIVSTSSSILTVNDDVFDSDLADSINPNSSFDYAINDIYNPLKPNDYGALLRLREAEIQRKFIEEKNLLQVKEMEKQREEWIRRRQDVVKEGRFHELESMVSRPCDDMNRSRGEGRGISNLPAWMTQKMASVAGKCETPQSIDQSKMNEDKMNEDKVDEPPLKRPMQITRPSKVILLENMALAKDLEGEGEIELLQTETAEECSVHGPVQSCDVKIVPLNNPFINHSDNEVKVYVRFERLDSAIKAHRALHGRYFGGRQLKVSYYDGDLK